MLGALERVRSSRACSELQSMLGAEYALSVLGASELSPSFQACWVFDSTLGAVTSGSWTGYSRRFRYTRQQWGWALPGEHTSAGLCVAARTARTARPTRQRRTRGLQQRRHRRRTAGQAGLQATQLLDVARRRRRTGASGITGYTAATPADDWRRRAAAPVEDRSRRISREPAAGVLDRRRPALGLGELKPTP
jgi:hypothetical protein